MTWSTSDGGGLLLQRFAQFVQQSRVLDGNDSLGGEVRESSICLSVKGGLPGGTDNERTDQLVLLQHRDARHVRTPPSSTAATDSGSRFIGG